jgi:hypothetical protein
MPSIHLHTRVDIFMNSYVYKTQRVLHR